jgi:hypothetical protein
MIFDCSGVSTLTFYSRFEFLKGARANEINGFIGSSLNWSGRRE